jgi:hypothetical protein
LGAKNILVRNGQAGKGRRIPTSQQLICRPGLLQRVIGIYCDECIKVLLLVDPISKVVDQFLATDFPAA